MKGREYCESEGRCKTKERVIIGRKNGKTDRQTDLKREKGRGKVVWEGERGRGSVSRLRRDSVVESRHVVRSDDVTGRGVT